MKHVFILLRQNNISFIMLSYYNQYIILISATQQYCAPFCKPLLRPWKKFLRKKLKTQVVPHLTCKLKIICSCKKKKGLGTFTKYR